MFPYRPSPCCDRWAEKARTFGKVILSFFSGLAEWRLVDLVQIGLIAGRHGVFAPNDNQYPQESLRCKRSEATQSGQG